MKPLPVTKNNNKKITTTMTKSIFALAEKPDAFPFSAGSDSDCVLHRSFF